MVNISQMQYMNKTGNALAQVYKPRIKVSFHTEKKCYHAYGTTAENQYGETLTPQHQVLSVTTQKSLATPAGSFTISLVGSQWRTYVKPNDVVVIEMGYYDGKPATTVMVGLIDTISVKRSVSADTGAPQINTTITGRDFAKMLIKDVLKFYPEINGAKGGDKFFLTDVGWVNLMKVFTADSIVKGTPAVILDNIMRFIFTKFNDTKWWLYEDKGNGSGAKKQVGIGEVIRYQFGKVEFFLPFMFTADQFEGSIWNMMERASIKPFTEFFIDVRDPFEAWNPGVQRRVVPHDVEESSNVEKGKLPVNKGRYPGKAFQFGEDKAKVVIAYRQTPYDISLRKHLVSHRIEEKDVLTDDLSISDNEHYNLFWAGTTVNPLGIDLKRVAPPIMIEENVKKYGLCPLEVQIEGLQIEDNKGGKALEGMSKKYTERLKNWFGSNHELWSGSIDLRGNPKIRIGHRVFYETVTEDYEYYVESVTQSFNLYEGFVTSLQVSRGQPNTEAKPKPKPKPNPAPSKPKPAPSNPPPKPTPAPKDKYYVVQKGDSLWSIAGVQYKNTELWTKIWDANKDMLIKRDSRNAKNPGKWIYPGQKLRIPPK